MHTRKKIKNKKHILMSTEKTFRGAEWKIHAGHRQLCIHYEVQLCVFSLVRGSLSLGYGRRPRVYVAVR